MIRILFAGIWICLVTLAAAYIGVSMNATASTTTEPDEFFGGLDYAKTEIISVPVIDDGDLQGYVIAQFVYTIDVKIKKKLTVPPDVFILDGAFRTIYENTAPDFNNLVKADLDKLTATIRDKVNARFQAEIVNDILVEIFNFVPKDSVRQHSLGRPRE